MFGNKTIKLKDLIYERFGDYKDPGLFLCAISCDWKCCKNNPEICQNMKINDNPVHEISIDYLYEKYISNPISEVIIIGGLEPMLQYKEVIDLIDYFRDNNCDDYFVIYTGYYENEIEDIINLLKQRKNIIVKFGRFIPNSKEKYDEILGVKLSSDNQYAKIIS